MLAFDELFQLINEHDESIEIEAKTAREMGKSILETICAFANEPNRGGGYIFLGFGSTQSHCFPDTKSLVFSTLMRCSRT